MLLYLTSHKDGLTTSGLTTCQERGCGQQHAHVCFATKPTPGQGEYVYRLDIPHAELGKYEYRNEFRPLEVRYFAIPLDVLRKYELRQYSFEALTGQPWNRWVISVLDRRNTTKPGVRGKWAIVWGSREGVATAKTYERITTRSGEVTYLTVEVVAAEDFDPTKDYIAVEQHEEFIGGPHGGRETWDTLVVGGTVPNWIIFPRRRTQYVKDKRIVTSYMKFLEGIAPGAMEWAHHALGRGAHKSSAIRDWWRVAEEVGHALSRRFSTHIELGKFSGKSWTQVNSAPIRIAKRASQYLPLAERWVPPFPEPEYEDPKTSGRYVLANNYGAHPTSGPGIDYDPQDRPYRRDLGSELDDDEDDKEDNQRDGDLPFDRSPHPLLAAF